MAINSRFLDDLCNRLTLSDIIGKRIKIVRSGREFKACCPFHSEKTPSFTINDDKQFYHCFGCGAHGNVINFVMRYDNVSFIDSVEMLAAEAGLKVPKQTPQEIEKAKREKDLYALLEDVASFFEDNLHSAKNSDALNYLLERGVSKELLQKFRIGFAPDDGQVMRKFLLGKGYSDEDMVRAGVLRKSAHGGEAYAFFRDRIMFPVSDRRGRIIAFGGRVLPENIRTPQKGNFTPPKYINSAENDIFNKGSILYGEPIARKAAAEGQDIVLVEGYLDVIACVKAGIYGAVAPMGTAVTEEQIISIWNMIPDFTKIPIFCFDGDNAGRKAARRVVDRVLPLLEPGRSINFAFMPEGQDPDSLVRDGGAVGIKKILNSSIPLFDFIWDSYIAGREFKIPELRAGVIKQLENEVSKISNKEVQMHYRSLLRQKISDTFFNFKRKNFNNFMSNGNRKYNGVKPISPNVNGSKAMYLFPRVLLATIVRYPHIFEGVEEYLYNLEIKDVRLNKLKENIVDILSNDIKTDSNTLLEKLKKMGFAQEIGDICNESVYVHAYFCSPFAKSEDVQSDWFEYYNDGISKGFIGEIKKGWKSASSEDDANRLRDLLYSFSSSDEAL